MRAVMRNKKITAISLEKGWVDIGMYCEEIWPGGISGIWRLTQSIGLLLRPLDLYHVASMVFTCTHDQ
jgi:hypothetical protein